ncbi:MAG: hypothetical protein R6X06_03145 [Gammaproteobacteria bacterium]
MPGCGQLSPGRLAVFLKAHYINARLDIRANPASAELLQKILRTVMDTVQVTCQWGGTQFGVYRPLVKDVPHRVETPADACAEYRQSDRFARAVQQGESPAKQFVVTMLSGSLIREECQRSWLADCRLLRGYEVMHVVNKTLLKVDLLNPLVRRECIALIYDQTL